jgi:hypothetical protein
MNPAAVDVLLTGVVEKIDAQGIFVYIDRFDFVFYLNFGNQAGAGLDDVGRGDEGRMLFHDEKDIDF